MAGNGISQLVKDCDLFAQPWTHQIQRKHKFSTLFGGLVSIVMVSALIPMTYFFGIGWLYKENPTIYKSLADKSLDSSLNTTINVTIVFELTSSILDVTVPFFQLNYISDNGLVVFEQNLLVTYEDLLCDDSDLLPYKIKRNASNSYLCLNTTKVAKLRPGCDLISGPLNTVPYIYLQLQDCVAYNSSGLSFYQALVSKNMQCNTSATYPKMFFIQFIIRPL